MKVRKIFSTKRAFRRALDNYFADCEEKGRVPNIAGFCRFTNIRRCDYFGLRSVYPLEFDVAESGFIDASVNMKVPNTGSNLEYLLGTLDNIGLDASLEVISEQPASDGD